MSKGLPAFLIKLIEKKALECDDLPLIESGLYGDVNDYAFVEEYKLRPFFRNSNDANGKGFWATTCQFNDPFGRLLALSIVAEQTFLDKYTVDIQFITRSGTILGKKVAFIGCVEDLKSEMVALISQQSPEYELQSVIPDRARNCSSVTSISVNASLDGDVASVTDTRSAPRVNCRIY